MEVGLVSLPIDLAFCMQQQHDSCYAMALAAVYRSIRHHTKSAVRIHIVHHNSLTRAC